MHAIFRSLFLILVTTLLGWAKPSLEEGFRQPPDTTKPWCYWYWISDNISREGITKDLESMARVGIGEALIGNIYLPETKPGGIKVLSEEWWGMVEHAIREGGRVGVNIGMFNSPGWSQSGGPWIQPDQAMRYLVSSEIRAEGPRHLRTQLPTPKQPFQQVAVQAFPAPRFDGESLAAQSPVLSSTPSAEGLERLVDDNLESAFKFPALPGGVPFVVEIALTNPYTARNLVLFPGDSEFIADCTLEAMGANGSNERVRSFRVDRQNRQVGVGPMIAAPVAVSFPARTASRFRISLRVTQGQGSLSEIRLSPAARLESYAEQQLGKMHQTPSPQWDSYLWPAQTEPDSPGLTVAPEKIIDLAGYITADGALEWDVPPGKWVILRTGMTPTGTRNAPASPEGQGLEVDKMNRQAAADHFKAFIGELLRRMPAAERKAFTRVVADSYEMGPENWTDGFDQPFYRRYGYHAKPWLPVLTGRLVGSAAESQRFLWDLRRLVADRVATDYVGALRELSDKNGVKLWLENYGHWGFPAEFLQYGGQSDRIGGEFWVTGLGEIECRAASSCANTYGKPYVSAEAFTGGPAFENTPGDLKARGDWAFCQGINHFVLHVYIHQPWEDRKPGINAWFGTEFNRHNTWFDESEAWINYLRRSCWLLQQGSRVADVAYFIGEDAPKMTGARNPPLPSGFDYDFINADVIEKSLRVKDGRLTLPHGASYRVLVLPDQPTMRPELLRKIRDLVKQGAVVLGPAPVRSPSLENYPRCDEEVQKMAADLWPPSAAEVGKNAKVSGTRKFGRGTVIWGRSLEQVFEDLNLGPDFLNAAGLRFTHRRSDGADIYFVANPKNEPVKAICSFRVANKQPELWWPDEGRIQPLLTWDQSNGTTVTPIEIPPHGSVFMVFRKPPVKSQPRFVSATWNAQELFDLKVKPPVPETTSSPGGDFTLAVWVNPADSTFLPTETDSGVHGLSEKRNDILFPSHGNTFGAADENTGAGLAAGTNGICIFEHTANHFAPMLVYEAPVIGWTHLALVYREGTPELWVNGKFARKGLKSRYQVHPSPDGGGGTFRGKLGGISHFTRALNAAEIGRLPESMQRPGDEPLPAMQVERGRDSAAVMIAWAGGSYSLKTSAGREVAVQVPAPPQPLELGGVWQVSFAGQDAPMARTLERLENWTTSEDPRIKFFSGSALYKKQFPAPALKKDQRAYLELGEVYQIASIRLNGAKLRTLWTAPWTLDVTSALCEGGNLLEIEVINAWNNRLVGDAAQSLQQRHSFLSVATVSSEKPLRPSGLIGPVRLRFACELPAEKN